MRRMSVLWNSSLSIRRAMHLDLHGDSSSPCPIKPEWNSSNVFLILFSVLHGAYCSLNVYWYPLYD